MGWFDVRAAQLACAACGSPIGRARYRAFPVLLEVMDSAGGALASERAGRVLQRLDAGAVPDRPGRRAWLAANAVEVVYELGCPVHGPRLVAAPAIAAAVRRAAPGAAFARVDGH